MQFLHHRFPDSIVTLLEIVTSVRVILDANGFGGMFAHAGKCFIHMRIKIISVSHDDVHLSRDFVLIVFVMQPAYGIFSVLCCICVCQHRYTALK